MAVPEKPPGDPAAMRALAAEIRTEAQRIGNFRRVTLSGWESDNAVVVRDRLQAFVSEAGGSASDLSRLATRLDTEADDVERDQLRWERARDRAKRDDP